MKVLCAALVFVLSWHGSTLALDQEFEGLVTKVLQADMLEVRVNDVTTRVVLAGIDAPEPGQSYAQEALKLAETLVSGKRVQIYHASPLDHNVVRAEVIIEPGRNLGHELLKAGLAWWDRATAPDDDSLWRMEREARTERRGLWEDSDPIPPWEWRRGF